MALAQGPKKSEPKLTITDLPSKINPGLITSGFSIPITAALPNKQPCMTLPHRGYLEKRFSIKPERRLSVTNKERLKINLI
ncbi:hypothetical protein [Desulfosarcina cetonica]|uniref:hypothetical protein n=1 Tax=Desulfosarcina cetonica TaxID=90730 RepID=UPI001FEE7083|nr:hypothetical protein [Desulfosarcina cetonica]